VHCAEDLPTIVGSRVTVGHGALLEGCVIEDEALVGMGAIVLQRARVHAGAMLAAGAVLGERRSVGPGMLAAGVPAQQRKELSGSAERWVHTAAGQYVALSRRYLGTAAIVTTSPDRSA
jgi:carbonic anhydrase/acetyltransferase-like protein (isoleucine patch superfamily)